jgi:hypothetical protein
VALARDTLGLLDGRADYPANSRWMHERLATLRRALTVLPSVVERA